MKKILAVFDGLKFSTGTQDFAVRLAKDSKAHLSVMFIENKNYRNYGILDIIRQPGGLVGSGKRKLQKADKISRARAAHRFERACLDNSLHYDYQHQKKATINDLINQTEQASLLIIDGSENFSPSTRGRPLAGIRQLLLKSKCPVLVLPHDPYSFEKLVFLYDGQPACMHALETFTGLLPVYKDLPMEVLQVNAPALAVQNPEEIQLGLFLKQHYQTVHDLRLPGIAGSAIPEYLESHPDSLVLMGAYQRNRFSRWIRPSLADTLLETHLVPLFIAHK